MALTICASDAELGESDGNKGTEVGFSSVDLAYKQGAESRFPQSRVRL